MTFYLTRAMLNRSAPERALLPLLDPTNDDSAFDAHHRLIWTLFSCKDKKRDFLWRADGRGKFFILSAREPKQSSLFCPLESKPFSPVLSVGDRLAFVLRVNATRDRRSGSQNDIAAGIRHRPRNDRRVDIVMHAMHEHGIQGISSSLKSESDAQNRATTEGRAAQRINVAKETATTWLHSQGLRRGFELDKEMLVVSDYSVRRLRRGSGHIATFGIIDLSGFLTVLNSESFFEALTTGFGRARAYGCGLMLVRRA